MVSFHYSHSWWRRIVVTLHVCSAFCASLETVLTARAQELDETIVNSIGMQLVLIPEGEFQMGSPTSEEQRSKDEVEHRVQITSPFYLGVFEVTQEEYEEVMDNNPSGFRDVERLPVENVSWEDALEFCRELSLHPEETSAGRKYRLPTEAEWEFACRAGTSTPFSFGETLTSDQANFDGTAPYGIEAKREYLGQTSPVGSYRPNAFGLFDMHGNVWEWCSDLYSEDYYANSPVEDPPGPATGSRHVIRGGSWYNFGHCLRSAYRYEFTPPLEDNFYGFRVVCLIDTPQLATNKTQGVFVNATTNSAIPLSSSNLLGVLRPTFASGGLFWIALLLLLLVLGNFKRLFSLHNVDLLALLIGAPFLFLSPASATLGVCLLMLYILLRFAAGVRWPQPAHFPVNLSKRPLALILGLAVSLHIYLICFTTIEPLTGLALWEPAVTRLVMVTFDLMIIAGLILVGKRWRHIETGIGLAVAYAVIPYTLMGIQNATHLIAIAASVWAFVFLRSPFRSGLLLVIAALANYSVVFLLPLWLFYYTARGQIRFGLGVASVVAVCLSFSAAGILHSPFVIHEQASDEFHFWQQHPVLVLSFGAILFAYSLMYLAMIRWPRRKSEASLVMLTALVLLGTQLWKDPSGSLGLQWFAPWLVLALAGRPQTNEETAGTAEDEMSSEDSAGKLMPSEAPPHRSGTLLQT